jgi:hypothetical protein
MGDPPPTNSNASSPDIGYSNKKEKSHGLEKRASELKKKIKGITLSRAGGVIASQKSSNSINRIP